jgi:hypothetical protein
MKSFAYVVECLAVPCLIGGVMYVAFDVWDRLRRRAGARDLPDIDYYI